MGRFIPIALRDHLSEDATTTCVLLKISPVRPGFSPYGLTSLDRDVVYDDGDGEVTYLAAVGTQPSMVQLRSDMSVSNSEAPSLMPEFDVPVSEEDIRAGALDYAPFSLYLVNWADLSQGHATLQSGTLGQVTIDEDGLSTINELRGLSVPMGQSVCEKDSLSCRATFGSQPGGSAINGPIERFPCGVDAEALLVAGTVSAVSLENTLTFTVTPFSMGDDELSPGMVFWQTGFNAQRSQETESNTSAGVITLAHPTDYPIQIGDTLLYRVDCNKQARDEVGGCKAPIRWGDDWPLHFRGEPDIPIGDSGAMETPGASSGPGQGAFTQIPFNTEAE